MAVVDFKIPPSAVAHAPTVTSRGDSLFRFHGCFEPVGIVAGGYEDVARHSLAVAIHFLELAGFFAVPSRAFFQLVQYVVDVAVFDMEDFDDGTAVGAGAACVFDDCPFEQSVRDDTSLAVALCPKLQSRAGYDFPFESLARFLRRLFREDGILAVAVAKTGCE